MKKFPIPTLIASGLLFLMILPLATLTHHVRRTLLNHWFIHQQLHRLDIVGQGKELALARLTPAQRTVIGPGIEHALATIRADLHEQLSIATSHALEFAAGRTPRLSLTLNLDPLRAAIRQELREVVAEQAAAELQGMEREEREQSLDQWTDDLMKDLPIPHHLTEADLPGSVPKAMETIRPVLTFLEGAHFWAVTFCLVLFGLLWRLGSVRVAGILLAIGGVEAYIMGFIAMALLGAEFSSYDHYLGSNGEAIIREMLDAFQRPATSLAWLLGLAGVGLFGASFLRRRPAAVGADLPPGAPTQAAAPAPSLPQATAPAHPVLAWLRQHWLLATLLAIPLAFFLIFVLFIFLVILAVIIDHL